jgi:hypothetical protein
MSSARPRLNERQVLLWIMIGFVLAYGGAFLLVATRARAARADTTPRPMVRWLAHPTRVAELMDPTLLALPNAHGFSGKLWQHGESATHRMQPATVELAYWSPAATNLLPVLLEQPTLPALLRATIHGVAAGTELLPVEPLPVVTQSLAQVEGDLAGRAILRQPVLPALTREAALRPTVVRVGVGEDGTVRYALLHRSCGDEATDAQAVQWAREFVFEPATGLAWGWVRFAWQTGP